MVVTTTPMLILLSLLFAFFAEADYREWKTDLELAKSLNRVRCDFPIINGNHFKSMNDVPYKYIPFVVTNLTDDWIAKSHWTKDYLLSHYGDRVVRSGSESSIVYSGGNAEFSSSLRSFIESFNKEGTDSFLFDTTVLNSIPELKNDFKVPEMFSEWDTVDAEKSRQIWHMLSLGPTRTG
jgi:hypothetical protein